MAVYSEFRARCKVFGAAVLISTSLLGGAVACGSGDSGGSGSDDSGEGGDAMVIALPGEPENLNPVFSDNIYEGNWKFFNGLLKYDRDLEAVPDLASEMPERSEDGLTVTVPIRDDVTFHDGEPLTAEDVAFTYGAILDEEVASSLRTLMDSVESVEATDDTTVEFTLNRPDPAFMDKLQVGIVPEHLLAGKDMNTADFNTNPVGTGPYRFAEWRPGERMVMERNTEYFDGEANIERVVFTYVEDENARAAMLENGSIDAAGLVPKLAPRFEEVEGYSVLEIPSADARTIALPNDNPAFEEEEVRRALSMAVDREAMVEGVLAGAGEPAYGPISPEHWAYDPEIEVPFDPDGARRMLEEAGWEDTDGDDFLDRDGERLGFTLLYPASDSVRRDVALAVSSDLAGIGVDATPEGLGWEAIEPRMSEDPVVFGYGVPYDPDIELWSLLNSGFADDDDPFTNAPGMQNDEIDAAMESARSTLDQGEREDSYREMQRALAEDGSWMYLVRLRHTVVMSDRISGVDPQVEPHAHGFSRGTSWNMEDWEIEGGA